MLYKLEQKFSEEEKKILRNFSHDNVFILRYITNKCYAEAFKGEGKFKAYECFGDKYVYDKKTYNLLIPNKIVVHRHRYLVEDKEEKGIWHDCIMVENGSLCNLYGPCYNLSDAIDMM